MKVTEAAGLIRALEQHEGHLVSAHYFFTGATNNRARIWMRSGTWWFYETHIYDVERYTLYVMESDGKWLSFSLEREPITKEGRCYLVIDEHDDLRYVIVDAALELPKEQRQAAMDAAEEE